MFAKFNQKTGKNVVTRDIKRTVGFVKQHDARIVDQGTRNRDTLLYAARQGFGCLPAHFGIVTVGHAHDDFIKPQTP